MTTTDPNISSGSPQQPIDFPGSTEIGTPPPVGSPQGFGGVSSSMEESQDIAIETALSASTPQLDALTNAVADNWGKSIAEQNELTKKKALERQIELQETKQNGPNVGVSDQMKAGSKPLIVDVTDAINNIKDPAAITAFIVTGVGLSVSINPSETVGANSPLSSITQTSSYMQTITPSDPAMQALFQDVTNMSVNLMVVPLAQILRNTAIDKAETKPNEKAATTFAREVIKVATEPNLIQMKIISQLAGTEKLSPKQREQLTAFVKLILALTAFAFLYNETAGGFTSKEVRDRAMGVIAGKIAPQNTEEGTLAKIIQAQLPILGGNQEEALSKIMAYLDSKPNFKGILDPLNTVRSVVQNKDFNAGKGVQDRA